MKRISINDIKSHCSVILLTLAMIFAFSMNLSAKDRLVQRGMTKEEVVACLGRPVATSFNQYGELWTYKKVPWLGPSKMIYVGFDSADRVATYQEKVIGDNDNNPNSPIARPLPPVYTPMPGMHTTPQMTYGMTDSDFSFLYGKVKNAFSDSKMDLIQVASLGCYYTCSQCAKIITIFSFSDDRLQALRYMAPHIVDPQNATVIYRLFVFDDDKDRAASIISNSLR